MIVKAIAAQEGRSVDVKREEPRKLAADAIANYAGLLVASAISVLTVRFLLRGLEARYGIWIAALALNDLLAFLNFGFGRAVVRQVAGEPDSTATRQFVADASQAYIAFGLLGGVIIVAVGTVLPARFGAQVAGYDRLVFVLAGMLFFTDQLLALGNEILAGLRRFRLISAITVAAATGKLVGILILKSAGMRLVAVAGLYAAVSLGAAAASLYATRGLRPKWADVVRRTKSLRARLPFSIASQVTAAFSRLTWQSGTLMLGVLLTAGQITPYYVGQRFPLALLAAAWSASAGLFPAASRSQASGNEHDARLVWHYGARSVLLLIAPAAAWLLVMAPQLLNLWLGTVPAGTAFVLRVTVLAVALDALASSSVQVLWGRGRMRVVLPITASAAITAIALNFLLIPRLGVKGAALGLCAAIAVGSTAFIREAVRETGASASMLLRSVCNGIVPAAAIAGITAWIGVGLFGRPDSWPKLLATGGAAVAAYAAALAVHGLEPEEKRCTRELWRHSKQAADALALAIYDALKSIGWLRSARYFATELLRTARDWGPGARQRLEAEYARAEDPLDYKRPSEQRRFECALEMLEAFCCGSRFERVLELGCAEGMFTVMLAPRCGQIEAVDFSRVALQRARSRCRDANVAFRELDLRSDAIGAAYDLILCIGVLEYLTNPADVARARDKMVAGLAPGGYLLVGSTVRHPVVEKARWVRWLRRGTWLNEFVADHPQVEIIRRCIEEYALPFSFVLLRKQGIEVPEIARVPACIRADA